MKSPLFAGSPRPSTRSAVLVVILAVLTLLSLIVLSLTLALESESQAAHYYAARSSADLLAQEGVEYVLATLLTAEQPTNAWATAPGCIYYWPTNSTPASAVVLPLSSGASNAGVGAYAPPDLNRLVTSEDSLSAITGSNTDIPMNVAWIYVSQDGTQTTNLPPQVPNPANPVIGRFAYWADDESSRINVNTAFAAAGNTNSLGHPSRIDLTSLFGGPTAGLPYAQEIYTNALVSSFNSPDDPRRLNADLASAISTNRFSLTHDSYSYNLNPWGQPKIILTTKQSVAGAGNTNFLNILTSPTADPGSLGNVNTTSMANEVNLLNGYLTNNWPGFPGQSFAQKYSPIPSTQLALDIIDYVRSVESTNVICEPFRGNLTGSTWDTSSAGTESLSSLFGTSRHPVITEVGFWAEPTETYPSAAAGTGHRFYVSVEVYLPPEYGIPSMQVPGPQFTTLVVQQQSLSDSLSIAATAPSPTPQTTPTLPAAWVSAGAPGGVLTAGNYCVITAEYNGGGNPISILGSPPIYQGRVSFKDSGGVLWELAPVGFNAGTIPGNGIPIPVNTVEWPNNNSGVVSEINDPRINKYSGDWAQKTETMGSQPGRWLTAVTAVPPQDTVGEFTGSPSTNSLYFPASGGTVGSVADLGYVTTGVNIAAAGIPWRSVRLQPTPASSRTLPPDWALLDLFQAPFASTNHPDIYQPVTNGVAGLINLNSSLSPFTNSPAIVRAAPLVALLQNANTNVMSPATNLVAGDAAANIGTMNLDANGTNYGVPAFISPNELAEVQGIADQGEASEANLRGLVDLATVRGCTFRVFSIGQTLKQTRTGALVFQSEQYKEAIVRQDPVTHHVSVLWKNISQ